MQISPISVPRSLGLERSIYLRETAFVANLWFDLSLATREFDRTSKPSMQSLAELLG